VATTRISRAQKHKCMIVKTADGARTSVSIPELEVDRYVAICYDSQKLFRRHLNAAVIETSPRAGRSRSQLIRASLDRRMLAVQAARAA
jgi:hypothetical protein